MKYFFDTEFLEGTQDKSILGIKCGKTKPVIDLISIGIVSEDGDEFYAISKDFNLKEAWNRFQIRTGEGDSNGTKEYWIRENVLRPIYNELMHFHLNQRKHKFFGTPTHHIGNFKFCYKDFKWLIKTYGKSNQEIKTRITSFIESTDRNLTERATQFCAYFADYDWVVFCWLFGKMTNLPKYFSMYCIDLKQTLDEIAFSLIDIKVDDKVINSTEEGLKHLKGLDEYPKNEAEHSAIYDARWNRKLHKFINWI